MPWYTCFGQIETAALTKGCLPSRAKIFLSRPVVKGLSRPQILEQYFSSFFILDKNITKKKCIDEIFTYWKFINWYFLILPYNWRKMFQKIAPKYYSIYVKGGSPSNACWLRTKSLFYPTKQINGTFML